MSFIRHVVCKCFLLIGELSFHSLNNVHYRAKGLILVKSKLWTFSVVNCAFDIVSKRPNLRSHGFFFPTVFSYRFNRDCESESQSVMSDSLWLHGLHSPWNSPGQNTRVGSLSLLQGIFPTQGSNPGPLHCGQFLYQLSHQGTDFNWDYAESMDPVGKNWHLKNIVSSNASIWNISPFI